MRFTGTTLQVISRGAACAALMCFALSAPALGQDDDWPDAKIGFVNFQKAIDLSLRGRVARKELQRTVSARQGRIEQLDAELNRLEKDYREKSRSLSGTDWDDYQARFRQRVKELRREGEDIQDEVARAERKLTEELLGELTVLVQRYGKEHGYSLVLEKNVTDTVHVDAGTDLTQTIIELYDSGALFETDQTGDKP